MCASASVLRIQKQSSRMMQHRGPQLRSQHEPRCRRAACCRAVAPTRAAVGIDLGTTTSAVALVLPGESQPRVLTDRLGKAIVPSVVAFQADGSVLVGSAAQEAVAAPAHGGSGSATCVEEQAQPAHRQYFYSTKRLMGRRAEQVAPELQGRLAYQVLSDSDGWAALPRPGPPVPGAPHTLLPQEVAAHVLRHLLERAEAHLGSTQTQQGQQQQQPAGVEEQEDHQAAVISSGLHRLYPPLKVLREAVITVPAHFGPAARAATVEAGLMAGLQRVELLQEPIAAAMAYGFGVGGSFAQSYATLLVFDLGGGTLDVSLLEGWDGILEVLTTDGDDELGGDDLTRSVAELLLQRAECRPMSSLPESGRLALTLLAERVKLSLNNSAPTTPVPVELPAGLVASSSPNASQRRDGAVAHISQRDVEQSWAPLLARMWYPLEQLAHASRLQFAGSPPSEAPAPATTAPAPDASAAPQRASVRKVQAAPHQVFAAHASASQQQQGALKYAAPPRRLTGVVLVGAATRTAAVRRFITQVCGMEPAGGADPEEVVALGAALHAGVLSGLVGRGAELTDGSYIASEHGRHTGWGAQHEDVRVEWTP